MNIKLGRYVVLRRRVRGVKEPFRNFVEKHRKDKSVENRAGGRIK